jgi:hypothetical protein
MLPLVLCRLEALQADLAAIDPVREIDAADRVAAMAVALREVLHESGALLGRHDAADAARAGAIG